MYTKYEEMKVIQSVLKNYISNQKAAYENAIKSFKEEAKSLSENIENSNLTTFSIGSTAEGLSSYKNKYESGIAALKELEKAIMCFEMGYTQENIQNGLADQRMKEGKKLFFELRTKNSAYKSVMEDIAYDLYYSVKDHHIDTLGMEGLDAKLESLDKDFEEGKLSKEQLIYYTNMCMHLSQNKDFIESINASNSQSKGAR